ncbi:MAG: HAD family phosphatase [Candidatus Doudnabacteria bacterium]|nr:HAD family phosphatase [Candidatus Doudnabacteria bacterium]
MIKGFFFDLDGTLVDTHRANFEAYRQALEDFGIELTFDEFKKSIGHQAKTFLPWFAPNLSSDELDEIAEKKKRYYKEYVHLSVLNTQLVEFLKYLKPHHAIVLVTTAKRANAETMLEHHGLMDMFDQMITFEDVTDSKPSPEAYQLALERTKLQPNEVIAFEDSSAGISAAIEAGIAVVEVKDFRP